MANGDVSMPGARSKQPSANSRRESAKSAKGKPHPDPVFKALAALGAQPSEPVFIGDSDHDIEAGRRAGVETAAVSWGPFAREALEAAGPSRWLESPEELLAL